MSDYPFKLVDYKREEALDDREILFNRPFTQRETSFAADARLFVPSEELEDAINTAIAVGDPLLLTGEPGTGKTQAGYYAAYKLDVEPVIHFQVKSDTTAKDLLYHFDAVKYFHEANLRKEGDMPDKFDYVEKRPLWQAFESDYPRVLLIDEIDKASRDFPNDLLLELDKMEFEIKELDASHPERIQSAKKSKRPIVFITSNSERRLPAPFLRRCVYHNIVFKDKIVYQAVEKRKHEYGNLTSDFIKTAIQRFFALRDRERSLRKKPSTSELLVWLRVLALAVGTYPQKLDDDLSRLPYIGVLLKDHKDVEELRPNRF